MMPEANAKSPDDKRPIPVLRRHAGNLRSVLRDWVAHPAMMSNYLNALIQYAFSWCSEFENASLFSITIGRS